MLNIHETSDTITRQYERQVAQMTAEWSEGSSARQAFPMARLSDAGRMLRGPERSRRAIRRLKQVVRRLRNAMDSRLKGDALVMKHSYELESMNNYIVMRRGRTEAV